MRYSEIEFWRLINASNLSIEDEVKANILGFIRTIHLNQLDFIKAFFDTEYFGKLPMTFQKNEDQVLGLITAKYNGEIKRFVFNEQGYELLEDLIKLGG